MANIDRPKGLEIFGEMLRKGTYNIPSAYAQDLFIGDPVVMTGTNNEINIATAGTGNPLLGAVLALYDLNGDPLQKWVSGQAGVGTVLVADDPMQRFSIQGDGDTSFLDLNDAGGNLNLVAGVGSSVYFLSGWELDDSATAGTAAADQVRLIRHVRRIDNTVAIANADWEVQINNHQLNAGIVGVGI